MNAIRLLFSGLSVLGMFATGSVALGQEIAPVAEKSEAAKTVTVKRRAAAVGDELAIASKFDSRSESSASIDGEESMGFSREQKRVSKKSIRILALDEKSKAPSRWEVSFKALARESKQEMPEGASGQLGGGRRRGRGGEALEGPAVAKPEELVGKTYIVTLSAEGPAAVTTKDGKKVSEEIARAVRREELAQAKFGGFGPQLSELLPMGPMAVGWRKEIPRALAMYLQRGTAPRGDRPQRGNREGRRGRGGEEGRRRRGNRRPRVETKFQLELVEVGKVLGGDVAIFKLDAQRDDSARPQREGIEREETRKESTKIWVGLNDGRVYRVDYSQTMSSETYMERGERTMERTRDSKVKFESAWIYGSADKKVAPVKTP